MTHKKLAIYARQSREKASSGSIDDQVIQGIKKAKDLGLEYEIYIDKGKSAYLDTFDNRPEFQRLIMDIEANKIEAVFVYDNSRLTRNDETNHLIKRIFRTHNVIVHSIIDGSTDFSDTESVLINDIKALFSMKAVKDSTIKIKSVLRNNAEKGRAHSGVIKPFGYTSDNDRMLIIEQDEAEIVKMIYEYSASGYGSTTIAKLLNEKGIKTKTQRLVMANKLGKPLNSSFNADSGNPYKKWAPNTVLSILKNPLYKGSRLYKGEYFPAPAIINESLWSVVQDKIQNNVHKPGLSKHNYLLKDLCVCGRCQSTFCGRTRLSGKDHIYYCSSRVKTSIKKCGIRSINIDVLENLVWSIVSSSEILIDAAKDAVDNLKTPEKLASLKKHKVELENSLSSFTKGRENILELISSGELSQNDAKNQLTINKNKITQLDLKLREINLQLNDINSITESIDYAKQFITDWNKLAFNVDFEQKYQFVRLFVKRITIDFDDTTEIFSIDIEAKIPGLGKVYRVDKGGNIVYSNENPLISDTLTSEMVWCGDR